MTTVLGLHTHESKPTTPKARELGSSYDMLRLGWCHGGDKHKGHHMVIKNGGDRHMGNHMVIEELLSIFTN